MLIASDIEDVGRMNIEDSEFPSREILEGLFSCFLYHRDRQWPAVKPSRGGPTTYKGQLEGQRCTALRFRLPCRPPSEGGQYAP